MSESTQSPERNTNLPFVEEIPCGTAEDFLDALRPSNERWRSDPLDPAWLFRGQSVDDPPIATTWRDHSPAQPDSLWDHVNRLVRTRVPDPVAVFQENDCGPFSFGRSPHREQFTHLSEAIRNQRTTRFVHDVMTEFSLLRRFCMIAEQAAYPIDRPNWIDAYSMGDDSNTECVEWSQLGERERIFEHPLVAAARHHGLPTRLIDWTTNPFYAAYFACHPEPQGHRALTVWAFRRQWTQVQLCHLREYHPPRHLLPNFANQEGRFLWQSEGHVFFALRGRWPTLIDSIQEGWDSAHDAKRASKPLVRITLPAAETSTLRGLLWDYRVFDATMMSGMDYVTRSVESLSRLQGLLPRVGQ